MPEPRTVQTKDGTQHFSIGAVIKKENKILLIDRKLPPPGYAGIAGHVDEKETPLEALSRELKEETNLDLVSHKLLFKKRIVAPEECVFKERRHKWYVYECVCKGDIKPSKEEVKSAKFFTKKHIKKLYKKKKLEYAWVVIFKKLGVI